MLLRFEFGETAPTDKSQADAVLVKIPNYIEFVGDPKNKNTKPINKQKEGTCWYYVLSYLRAHYGNQFPKNDPNRYIEIIFSTFRKRETLLDKVEEVCAELSADTKSIENKISILKKSNQQENEIAVEILQAFLTEAKPDINLQEYIKNKIYEILIEDCLKVARELAIDITTILKDYGVANDLSNLAKKVSAYQGVLKFEAYKKNHLIPSEWHPQQDIHSVINIIRTKGPFVVFGKFGANYYNKKAELLQDNFGEKPVYGWQEADHIYEPGTHAIYIIGADSRGYVYYLNPNHAADKLFRIDLDCLKKYAHNMMAQAYNNYSKGPFAFHPNYQRNQFLLDQFQQNAAIEEMKLKKTELIETLTITRPQAGPLANCSFFNGNKLNVELRNSIINSNSNNGLDTMELKERQTKPASLGSS